MFFSTTFATFSFSQFFISTTIVELLCTASYEYVMTNGNRTSREAIQGISQTLGRSFAREATSCRRSSIPVLGNAYRGLAYQDQVFICRCRRASIARISITFNGGLATLYEASFYMSGRFFLSRRLIYRVSNNVRVASSITLRIRGRIFRPFFLRLFRNF